MNSKYFRDKKHGKVHIFNLQISKEEKIINAIMTSKLPSEPG